MHVDGLKSRVILKANDIEALSIIRTTDTRTALARGLAEYLKTLSITWEGGGEFRFADTLQTWAESETPPNYPSAVIVGSGDAEYQAAELTPVLVKSADGTNQYLGAASELYQRFRIEIWTMDPVQRMMGVAMVEEAMDPTDFMTGLRLELPYYFNARATYEKVSLSYDDSAADAQRRWRKATLLVTGHIPQYRKIGTLVNMRPRAPVDVT